MIQIWSITEKMNARALKSAGLKTVPQQSNMSEWLAFRKCLDVQGDRHAGWEDIFSTVLASSTILAQGNRTEDLEIGCRINAVFYCAVNVNGRPDECAVGKGDPPSV